MNISKKFIRVIIGIVVILQCVSMITVEVFASLTNEVTPQNETKLSGEDTSVENINEESDLIFGSENALVPVIAATKVALNESVEVSFDTTGVKDYYYVANGVSVTEIAENSMRFEIVAVEEFGSVDFYANYGDSEFVKGVVYTFIYNDTVYVSDISKDSAWYDCMKEQYESGLITQEEWDESYSKLSQSFAREYVPEKELNAIPMTVSEKNTAWGWLSWELENGTILPLRNTWVELWDYDSIDSDYIAGMYTDEDGFFSFTFDNDDGILEGGYDLFIRWYTKSETFEVNLLFTNPHNYIDSGVKYQNVANGAVSFFAYCVEYDETIIVNKSFYIQQGMIVGQNFADEMGLVTENYIHVYYPGTLDGLGILKEIENITDIEFLNEINDSAFCWGNVLNNCFSVIGLNTFDKIDKLVHEYGHYVEHSMGNYGASLFEIFYNWPPTHNSYDDHFNEGKQKEYAMELTWSEAWATAFSQIAQSYYSSEYDGVEGFADLKDSNGGWNYEKFKFDANSGEAQEDAVIAFLWDLFDKYSDTEKYDCIALDYQNWWTFTTRTGTYTLQDFVNVIDHFYPHLRGDVGQLLSDHHISPGVFCITNMNNISPIVPPKLSWSMNGSEAHPNNMFQVVFYDTYGELIYECEIFSVSLGYRDNYIYSVSQEDWDEILSRCSSWNEINVAVRGYREDEELTSGPYISAYDTITKLGAGRCGDDVYWYLSSTYELTIYGSGEMYGLDVYYQYPWAEYSENITSITVASGVIHIGDYAFENCGADSVSLPEGLLSIGEGAFKGCAFSAITLPSTLTTIEGQAFADCTALTSINIPALVTSIGERAFEGCSSLTEMIVDSGNAVYVSTNNCIIDIAAKAIIAGCNGSVIPEDENVTTIGRYAFAGCGFTSISIPSTITTIDYKAFYGCTALTSVNLPDTLSCIGDSMFEGCTALSSITIPSNVTEIGAGAFKDCTALTEITIPASVSTIGEGAFAYSGVTVLNFSRVNDWTYGNGTAVSESALEGASTAAALLKGDMVNYTITRSPLMSEALTSTTYWEISHDGALIIYGHGDMPDYSDGEAPWVAYTDLFNAVKIKEGIYYVGRCSFYDLDNITSVSLPESLMVIGTYAFYSCNGFNTLNIPAKVFKIGAYALRKTSITNFTMDSPNGWKSNGIQFSGDVAEIYLNLKGDIVNGVSFTAYKHSFLRDDVCEGDVVASGEFANGRMSWTLNDKGVLTVTGSGAMPEFYTGIIPWESYMSAIRRVVIGEGITTVGRCSFPSCSTLEEVTLPSTLTHINAYAFAYCKSLKEIEIPASVIFIADSAFTDSGITDVPTV